jgi:transposase
MPAKKYIVTLTDDEKNLLKDIVNKGKHSASKRKRAQALLLANEQHYTDDAIAERSGLSRSGIEQLRLRFVENGFEVTLEGKPRGHRPRKLSGEDEARLIALTCSEKPDGSARWSLRLLRDKWETLANTDVDKISHELIRRTLKKTNLSRGKTKNGASHRKGTRIL